MWRRRRWGDLLNLIDRLPRNSHFQAALAADEEYARQVAAVEAEHGSEAAREWRPPMETFSAEVEAAYHMANQLENLTSLVLGFMGGKAAPKFVKGPKTAIEEFQTRTYVERRQKKHDALVARLVPHVLERKGKSEPPVG